ncbi:DUF4062 domain-containing protein [Pelistega europaea]|uniref:DUF4062 domain-containing protein n=1 Tax=Pelistega europaea TaxID=106147 RepID=A0A7Y4L802_9BURK|nr:DUF4062 domain-containing protein [Pelistega europaea]NOL48639.1 DUF4062 domain-containing protein [Pelistega europaea]
MRLTFRFFVSSTFSDFENERRILHEKVFPAIDNFCQQGVFELEDFKQEINQLLQDEFKRQRLMEPPIQFSSNQVQLEFQPIDLRWGINEEAQKDHQTMAICLSEVQRCIEYPYPNFMLMIGDRYGWVPLPTFIKEDEFEILSSLIKPSSFQQILNDSLKSLRQEPGLTQTMLDEIERAFRDTQQSFTDSVDFLRAWYQKDENQIPVAYRLRERAKQYQSSDSFGRWRFIESVLRALLTIALDASDFTDEKKKYYTTSATEAEFLYGVPGKQYKDNVFIFCRHSSAQRDSGTTQFLEKIKKEGMTLHEAVVNNTNTVGTIQETDYLSILEDDLIQFIQERIKQQLRESITRNIKSETDIHKKFAKEKIASYVETNNLRNLREKIQDKVKSSDADKPILLYGSSGSGKSALMAFISENLNASLRDNELRKIQTVPLQNSEDNKASPTTHAEQEPSLKIITRFVGASASSSSFFSLFESIFQEAGIPFTLSSDTSMKDACKNISGSFGQIKNPCVIFIDALDQLNLSQDTLHYLDDIFPASLPAHVKVVISALKDENYKEDTKYYEKLKNRTQQFAMPAFDGWEDLLDKLLDEKATPGGYSLWLGKQRTLTKAQKDFIARKYQHVNTPFFIKIIHQEVKNWPSWYAPPEDALGDSNQSAVQHFIDNLSKKYHHEQELVRRVLCWFAKTKEGLSEYQIRTLLDVPFRYAGTDNAFVLGLANSVCSQNIKDQVQKMPNVYWSRLFFALLPFLKRVQSEQAELLNFFHREFNSAVEKKYQENLRSTWEMIFHYLSALLYDGQEVNIDNALQTIKQQWLKLYNKEAIHYAQRTEEEHHSGSIAFIEDKLALFKQKAEEDQARNTLTEDGQHERVWINEYYKSRVALSIVPFQNYPLDKANNNDAFGAASFAHVDDKLYKAVEYYHQTMLDTQTEFVHFNELRFSRKELAHYLKVAEIYLHTYLYLRLEKKDTSRFADFDLKRFQKSLLQLMLYAV